MSEVELTKERAIQLVQHFSWQPTDLHECPTCTCEPPPPSIHTRAGGFGADWTTAALVGLIKDPATRVEWGSSLLGDDLVVVRPDGRELFVDVSRSRSAGVPAPEDSQ